MITSVGFCLSYDILNAILPPSKFFFFIQMFIVVTDVVTTLLVPAKSVMKRVVITLFMTWRYLLNNSNVM